jgi:adenylosuccinate lyase
VWYAEMGRSRRRLEQAREEIATCTISGAVGTHANVPAGIEDRVAEELGLRPEPVSTQIVQRDRHAAYVLALALLASSLDKMATELRNLQHTEILEVEEPFRQGQQGSSAMPHKRNPILNERIGGLARVVRGYAVPALENVVLWHERDISNSSAERVILPDASILSDYMLALFARIVEGMRVREDRMAANLESSHGLIFSEKVLTALIDTGLTRPQAYALVQRAALRSWQTGEPLRAILEADPEVTARLGPEAFDRIFDLGGFLHSIDVAFERLGLTEGALTAGE